MEKLWQAALTVAGVGSVGAFVFWSLYHGWLRLPIFQQLRKIQLYRLFQLFFVLTFLFALAALTAYVLVTFSTRGSEASALKSSQDELVAVIDTRRDNYLKALDNMPMDLPETDRTWLSRYRDEYDRLSRERRDAFASGRFVFGYELDAQLDALGYKGEQMINQKLDELTVAISQLPPPATSSSSTLETRKSLERHKSRWQNVKKVHPGKKPKLLTELHGRPAPE